MTLPPSGPVDLEGQSAVVTGATGGIGSKICSVLAREGADVVATDVTEHGLDRVRADVESYGRRCVTLECDVTDEGQTEELREVATETCGSIEILVTSHGVATLESVPTLTLEEWNTDIEVNLTGTYLVAREFVDHMVTNSYGKITLVGSQVGEIGGDGQKLGYTAAKGGVHVLGKSLAVYGGPHSVNANVVSPGLVRTPASEDTGREFSSAYSVLGRVGRPEDIAEAVLFTSSQQSNWMTGMVLRIDGGTTLYGGWQQSTKENR